MGTARVQKKGCSSCASKAQPITVPANVAPTPSMFESAGPPLGLVQKKVVVGEVGDRFEQQADEVAAKVTAGEKAPDVQPMGAAGTQELAQAQAEEPVQAQAEEPVQAQAEEPVQAQAEEPVQAQAEEPVQAQAEEPVQAQAEEPVQAQAEEPVQAAEGGDGGGGGDGSAASVAASAIASKGSGQPMLTSTRRTIEHSLGKDLGDVRVHQGGTASRAAHDMGARAFTHGTDIWLGTNESQHDVGLMAHESTHVLQQDGKVRRSCERTTTFADFVSSVLGQGGPPPAEVARGGPAPEGAATGPAAAGPAAAEEGPAPAAEGPAAEGAAPATEAEAPTEETVGAGEVAEGAAPAGAAPAAGGPPPPLAPRERTIPSDPREPIMPAPPETLSAAAESRISGVGARAGSAAETTRALPPAEENVGEARGAVTEPESETAGRAEAARVAELRAQAQPSPEIEELCTRIREIICSRRPPDEDSLVEADPRAMATEAGQQLESNVEGDADRVAGEYEPIDTPPQGTPALEPEAIEDPPATVDTPDLAAGQATPDAVPAEDVSLDDDVAANQRRMEEAGMDSAPARLVEDGPIAEARAAQGDLEETARRDPAEVLAEQTAALGQANADMEALQLRAAESLMAARTRSVEGARGQQDGMVESEQQTRDRISGEAQAIFETTRTAVMDMIRPLAENAMTKYERGVAILSTQFETDLQRVSDWIDERHSGVGGFFTGLGDAVFGLPDWVTEEYDRAEQAFGDGMCELIREISTDVNTVILAAEQLIQSADDEIAALFQGLGPELEGWAAEQQAQFSERLSGLTDEVHQTRDDFNRDLRQRASQAVDDVRTRIHDLRQAARGLIGRIADAIDAFLDDPARFIINGLLRLLGISPSAFWALVRRIEQVIDDIADDPETFANNLMAALKKGFQQFFDNFPTHLLNGFLQWLFSGLGSVGVTIPTDFSLKSVITFFLQIMGITWPRIRRLIAKHIGEENVALIEKAYELVSLLIEKGPEGIFEMIKEQLNPQTILDAILDAAIDYLMEALITRITARIIMMFNPAGAILQAIEAVYRVVKWIFENAARIFTLVETIVNGVADLIAGRIDGMANAVERALAGLIPPVIDFLAGFLGLGGLPDAVANAVRGLQESVERILDRVIGWLAGQARRLLRALGIGGEDEEGEAGSSDVGETMPIPCDDSSHTLSIESEGSEATFFIASRRERAQRKLTDWRAKANGMRDDEAKANALEALARFEADLNALDAEADRILAAKREASSGSEGGAAPDEATFVTKERQLITDHLTGILNILGEDLPATRRRLEQAQNKDNLQTEFTSQVWQAEFGVSMKTSYRDFDAGILLESVEKVRHGAYRLKPPDLAELVRMSKEAMLQRGTTALGRDGSVFTNADIKTFLAADERTPRDESLYTDAVLVRVVNELKGNGLTEASGGYQWSLEDVEWRDLPTSWSGEDVRRKYYINGSDFASARGTIQSRGISRISRTIADIESGDPIRMASGTRSWATLASQEVVPDPSYNPRRRSDYTNPSNFDVDHATPLAYHWLYLEGNNMGANERQSVAGSGGGNLKLMWASLNRSKGAAGPRGVGAYVRRVGRSFTHQYNSSFYYADESTPYQQFAHLRS